jgi:uncharacterized protein (TIGR02246 family)
MNHALLLALTMLCATALAQPNPDESAIREILQEQVSTWNSGDAAGYSRHFADNGTFTNIQGLFFQGHKDFLDRHDVIFKGFFHGTVLQQDVVSLKFITREVAIVETLTSVSRFAKSGLPPHIRLVDKGRLRTRLLQVLTKQGSNWKIVAYHNVDVKPGMAVPEPK